MNSSASTIFCLIILLVLTASCASQPRSNLLADDSAAPTPTPFQPKPGPTDSLFSGPALPATEPPPTYTPVPTVRAGQNSLLPAQVISPALGSGDDISGVNNPLTGLPFPDPALANRRPLAIKVGNFPRYVRPQSGLSLADVVYEYYTEWGETRFIGIFYSKDASRVGPVRSGRFFDEHILRMYHAFLVYKFSDPRERKYFFNSDFAPFLVVPDLSVCPPFDGGRGYNDYFFDTTGFSDCVEKKHVADNSRQNLRSGFFSDQLQPSTQTAARIYTHYSSYSYNYWDYDPVAHKYFRYEDDVDTLNNQPQAYLPLTDALTGLPITTDNLIEIFVSTSTANQYDAADQVYHIDPVGSGLAFAFRDGLAYPGRWYRTDMDQPLLIVNDAGLPIYLKPGQSFYEVIGESSKYVNDGDQWFFNFSIP